MDVHRVLQKRFGWISAGRLQDAIQAEIVENDQGNAVSTGVIAMVVHGGRNTSCQMFADQVAAANIFQSKIGSTTFTTVFH